MESAYSFCKGYRTFLLRVNITIKSIIVNLTDISSVSHFFIFNAKLLE